MTFVLHYGDNRLVLANSDEIDIVMADIQRAVQSGGGWVAIETKDHGVQHLLFAAGQYVRLARPAKQELDQQSTH